MAVLGKTQQIELAIAPQVGRVKDQRRPCQMVEEGEFVFFVSEPNERARRTLRGHWSDRRQIKIERSVVVQVSDAQAHLTREIVRRVGDSGDLSDVPGLALILVRNSNNGTVGLNRQQIQHSVVIGIGYCDRFNGPKIGRDGTFAELALALVDKDVKPSRSIDDRGIRIAVSGKISPDKLAHA